MRCMLCSRPYAHIHHVYYRSHGGANIRQNMVCLCRSCHEMCHQDEVRWRNELLERLRGYYGIIELDDLKKKGRYSTYPISN